MKYEDEENLNNHLINENESYNKDFDLNKNKNEENEKDEGDESDDDNFEELGKKEKNKDNNEINKEINQDKSLDDDEDVNLENLNSQEDNNIKFATILASSFCIFTILLTYLFSDNGKKFLTFNSEEKERLFINKYIIYGYLLYFMSSNVILIIFLSFENEDNNLKKILYQNLRWFFIITQFFFGFLFLIEIYWGTGDWTLIFSVSVSMIITILLAFYYEEIKVKKNMTNETLFSIFIYISFMFAFVSFITIFNFSCILINSLVNNKYQFTNENVYIPYIKIGTNFFQTTLGIVLLTYFKDLFFVLSSIFIEFGILIEYPSEKKTEKLWLIIFIILLVLNSALCIFRYGKKTIGIEKTKNN